jgi:signal transduction histidine kinase/DNA-binding LacI/PurR family transcriptional regulator
MTTFGAPQARPVVGMLTQDLLELYAEQWLGVVDAAGTHGCDLICFCGRALADSGSRKQANALYDLVTDETLDGLIVWASTLGVYVGQERMEQFCTRFEPLPMVSVEQPLGQAPVVLMDNRQGMYDVVSHLIEVHGHRRIGFIRGPVNHDGAEDRYRGYLEALAHHGLVATAELMAAPPLSWDPEWAAASVFGMLATAEPPDAIAAANDDLATGVLTALAAADVRTPEEIAVVGFDDSMNIRNHDLGFDSGIRTSRRTVNVNVNTLSLTTVRAPFRELGRRALDVVLGLIRGETVPRVVNVPTELVVRRSCGCLPVPKEPAVPVAATRAGDRSSTHIRRALMHRSAQLPDDWPEQLSAAFVREMHGESDGAFLRLLDQFVQSSLRSGERVENWWSVLFELRRLIGRPTASAAEITQAEDLWLRAQVLLNETAERHWRYEQVCTERRDHIVREVGHRLVTAPDVAGLADVLADELPKVGIAGCYLAAYEQPAPEPAAPAAGEPSRAQARLLLSYENGVRTDVTPDSAVFPSVQLVPGDRLRRATPYSMVAVPLYFKDEQLGFALFELGPRIGWIYAALQEQVGSALHRTFMVERERMALAAVEEAHRREERHRLASDLHDSVSQALFSMTLHTRAVELAVQEQGWDPQSRVVRGLTELRELTQGALTEMRALIFQLRPDALREEGLVAAIRRHAAAVAAREGFDLRVHAPEDRLPLDDRAEDDLFRVVQEALHNTVKHASPGRVDIRLYEPADATGTLIVEVADDGAGFDPDGMYPGHLGLAGMRERTQRLGGRFAVDSSPAGSTVRAVLPDILRPAVEAPATHT